MKTDIGPVSVELYFIEVKTRVPLRFGLETPTSVTCARVCMTVADSMGRKVTGWGETPLSVQWAWPSRLSYDKRHQKMRLLCKNLAEAWAGFARQGHPIELGNDFIESVLPGLVDELNRTTDNQTEHMLWLAALVCCSAFDVALHDAYGKLLGMDVYSTYNVEYMNEDLSSFLEPAKLFAGKYPADFLGYPPARTLPAWHLVGGKDLLDPSELTGDEPDDGYPVLLTDWIRQDGFNCLKVKLRGNDYSWDIDRLIKVGKIAIENNVTWLTSDFNCTVTDPEYVNDILDSLILDHPRIFQMILYVEQPFPYDLEQNQIDVHSVSARKPLFMDESAHD